MSLCPDNIESLNCSIVAALTCAAYSIIFNSLMLFWVQVLVAVVARLIW